MNRIDLIIPTRGRIEKLKRTLATIPAIASKIPIDVILLIDNCNETLSFAYANNIKCNFFPERHGSVWLRNWFIRQSTDAVIYGIDDVEFRKNAFDQAVDDMQHYFPDDDGLIGFMSDPPNAFNPAWIGLVGKKFIDRFHNRELFYPGYFHFACYETHLAAEKFGKFHLSLALAKHYHPGYYPGEMDRTHEEGREHQENDKRIKAERIAKGLLWGVQ